MLTLAVFKYWDVALVRSCSEGSGFDSSRLTSDVIERSDATSCCENFQNLHSPTVDNKRSRT